MKVKVVSTLTNKVSYVDTQASNWGALESQLKSEGLISGTMQALIKENRHELSHEEAILPTGLGQSYATPVDFTIFLSPKQVKSGGLSQSEIHSGFEDLDDFLKDNDAPYHLGVFIGQLRANFEGRAMAKSLPMDADEDLIEARRLAGEDFTDTDSDYYAD